MDLENVSGIKAIAGGVQPRLVETSRDYQAGTSDLREEATIDYIAATVRNASDAKYTIDWLENVDDQDFVWPTMFEDKSDTTETRTVGGADNGITLVGSNQRDGASRKSEGSCLGTCDLPLRIVAESGQT